LAADSVAKRLLDGLAPGLELGGLVLVLGAPALGLGAAAGGLVAAACARAGPAAARNRKREITSFPMLTSKGFEASISQKGSSEPGNDPIAGN
jgi:hypothetical protein